MAFPAWKELGALARQRGDDGLKAAVGKSQQGLSVPFLANMHAPAAQHASGRYVLDAGMPVLGHGVTIDMVEALRPQPHSQQSRQALEVATPVGRASAAVRSVNGKQQSHSRLLEASHGRSVRSNDHALFNF
jgi:hypothetical protein